MFRASKLDLNNLEFLVRTAIANGELSPGVASEIARYRASAQLSVEATRYLAILDDAISDGCVQMVGSIYSHEAGR